MNMISFQVFRVRNVKEFSKTFETLRSDLGNLELAKFRRCLASDCRCARFFLAVDGMQFGFALDVYIEIDRAYVWAIMSFAKLSTPPIIPPWPRSAPAPPTHSALAVVEAEAKKQSRQRKYQK